MEANVPRNDSARNEGAFCQLTKAAPGSPRSPLRDSVPGFSVENLAAREDFLAPFPLRCKLGITPSSGVFRRWRVLPGCLMLRSAFSRRKTKPALTANPRSVPNEIFITGCGLYGTSGALLGSTIRIG